MRFWSYTEQNAMVLLNITIKLRLPLCQNKSTRGLALVFYCGQNQCWSACDGNLLGYCYGGHLESQMDACQVVRDEREPPMCLRGLCSARFICRCCKICNTAPFVCWSVCVSEIPLSPPVSVICLAGTNYKEQLYIWWEM